MKPDQKDIYYITGENISALSNSPHLEKLKDKDYEILLMADPVDEWVVQSLNEYDGKSLKSAEKGDLDLDPDKEDSKKKDEFTSLFSFIKSNLEDKVKEVKASTHLKDSVACLSGDTNDMSAYMDKIMKASGQKAPETKRVLEVNVNHSVISAMTKLYEKNRGDASLKEYSRLLFDIAVISEGGKLDNPARFSKMMGEMMAVAIEE